MTDNSESIAVSVGKIQATVEYIKESTERRLSNNEQFQITVQETLSNHESRIVQVETSMKNSFAWLGVMLTIVTIAVNVILKFA